MASLRSVSYSDKYIVVCDVVLICLSLMTTDVEYVVMCIFVILCICLGGVSVQTFCHLKTFKKIEL